MIGFIIFIMTIGLIPLCLMILVLERHKRQLEDAQEDTSNSRKGFLGSPL